MAAEFPAADVIAEVVATAEGFSTVPCDLKTWLESGASAQWVRAEADLIARSDKPRSS